MATTSPDNIRTPNSGDQYALVQDMGILADTVQNALIKRANAYTGTVAQRNAFESSAPTGTIWSDTNGDRLVWKKGATGWDLIVPEPEPRPKCIAGRTLASSSANTLTLTPVQFPTGFFSSPPAVIPQMETSVAGTTVVAVTSQNITASGFDIGILRTNNTNTWVNWVAMEMGEVS